MWPVQVPLPPWAAYRASSSALVTCQELGLGENHRHNRNASSPSVGRIEKPCRQRFGGPARGGARWATPRRFPRRGTGVHAQEVPECPRRAARVPPE